MPTMVAVMVDTIQIVSNHHHMSLVHFYFRHDDLLDEKYMLHTRPKTTANAIMVL